MFIRRNEFLFINIMYWNLSEIGVFLFKYIYNLTHYKHVYFINEQILSLTYLKTNIPILSLVIVKNATSIYTYIYIRKVI